MRFRRSIVSALLVSLALAASYFGLGTIKVARTQSASAVTDKFAAIVLQGGCSIRLASTGRTVTTDGSGGACPTTVKAMLDHLSALNPQGLRVAVVSESEDHPSLSKSYRFVASFNARSGSQSGDIFLSLLGSPDRFSNGFIEAMGFDDARKAYVFYNLDDGQWVQVGDSTLVPIDSRPTAGKASMACQNCHTTGMPLMRELQDSWSNWQSRWDRFKAPAITDPLFDAVFGGGIAEALEPVIIARTKVVAAGRVDRAVSARQTGLMLRQAMCDVGEPSLIAVHQRSKSRWGDVVTETSMLPGAILLNQIFAAPATGSGTENGLEGNLKMTLPEFAKVKSTSAAYMAALKKLGISFEGMPGLNDAKFAWFSPSKSYADLAVTMDLLARNLIDRDVLADAMMVDFTTPMFSKVRCDLADTIPANFTSAEELRTAWIANLANSSLRGASGLKSRLEKRDDFADHEKAINDFLRACAARSSEAAGQFNEDVLTIVAQRRNEFRVHYSHLIESPLFLPTDNGSAQTAPGTWRLSAAACELERQSSRFHGE